MVQERSTGLSELAGYGLINLDQAQQKLSSLSSVLGLEQRQLLAFVGGTQDPDQCLELITRLARDHKEKLNPLTTDEKAFGRLCRVLGASAGLFDFLTREPQSLALFSLAPVLPTAEDSLTALTKSANNVSAIRIAYRTQLLKIAIYDVCSEDPGAEIGAVSEALADLAAAAIEAGLHLARTELSDEANPTHFPRQDVSNTRISVIGMGLSLIHI